MPVIVFLVSLALLSKFLDRLDVFFQEFDRSPGLFCYLGVVLGQTLGDSLPEVGRPHHRPVEGYCARVLGIAAAVRDVAAVGKHRETFVEID